MIFQEPLRLKSTKEINTDRLLEGIRRGMGGASTGFEMAPTARTGVAEVPVQYSDRSATATNNANQFGNYPNSGYR